MVICPYLWQAPGWRKDPLALLGEARWFIQVDVGGVRDGGYRSGRGAWRKRSGWPCGRARARRQLLLVWAQVDGRGAPLPAWLFGADAIHRPIEQLSLDRLEAALAERAVPITLLSLPEALPGLERWRPPLQDTALGIGAVPSRLDRSWGRASYSAWIATAEDPTQHERGRDRDPGAEEAHLPLPDPEQDQGPLGMFPRGATAGDCLHRILEQFPFTAGESESRPSELIEGELRRAGLDPALADSVEEGLIQVLETPLGGALGSLRLGDIPADQRLHELSFDLPVRRVRTSDLVAAFQCEPTARFGPGYAEQLQTLAVNSRGFLTGSIDLVFQDPTHGKWWVLDWKSIWIGERGRDAAESRCGPAHYHQAAMDEQMVHHHYPSRLTFIWWLHRHLAVRLPGLNPSSISATACAAFCEACPGRWAGSRLAMGGRVASTKLHPCSGPGAGSFLGGSGMTQSFSSNAAWPLVSPQACTPLSADAAP